MGLQSWRRGRAERALHPPRAELCRCLDRQPHQERLPSLWLSSRVFHAALLTGSASHRWLTLENKLAFQERREYPCRGGTSTHIQAPLGMREGASDFFSPPSALPAPANDSPFRSFQTRINELFLGQGSKRDWAPEGCSASPLPLPLKPVSAE